MSSVPLPQTPHYRITLFYGPEPVDGDPPRAQCVFNVKKRSWRSGVQVAVEVTAEQMTRAGQAVELDRWLPQALASVPEDERDDYETRAQDLFAQAICALKLHLAIEAGIPQENQCLASNHLTTELDGVVTDRVAQVKSRVLDELDLNV